MESIFFVIKWSCLVLAVFSLFFLTFAKQSPGAAVLLFFVFMICFYYFNVKQMRARIKRLTEELIEEAKSDNLH